MKNIFLSTITLTLMFRDKWNLLKKGPSGGPGSFINNVLITKIKYKRYPSDGRDVTLAKESQELIILAELELIILQIHLPVGL